MNNKPKSLIRNGIIRQNKGFTLVELIVVLILMTIIISISIAAGLGWKDWADFNHENSMAEEIFFAAQNQLTEYDSSQTLDLKLVTELKKVGTNSGTYDSSIVLSQNMLEQISYDMNGNSEVKYKWDDVWKLNKNPDSQRGTIIRLKANKGDYKDYLAGTLVTETDKTRLGAKILFDLISGFVSDAGALDAAISLEFSPDSGQVFSVCYSDKCDLLLYSDESAEQGKSSVSVMNRILNVRNTIMLGYYSVTELAQRIKGRGLTKSHLELEMENSELLTMKVIDKGNASEKLGDNDSLIFNIYNGQAPGNILMTFNIDYKNIKSYSTVSEGLSESSAAPMNIKCSMQAGLYKNNYEVIFRLPVWRIDNQIYIVLDAADVQAQSLAYSESIYFGQTYSADHPNSGEVAFRNTYSFYRFGFADVTNYIYADVSVGKLGYAMTDAVESGRRVNNKHVSHSKLVSEQKDGFKGECVCFNEYSRDLDDNVFIDINNARHLYNVRYETDYKRQNMDSIKETYKLVSDISWKNFIGLGEDSTVNYFLNSYDTSVDNISRSVSGIDYDGKLFATRSVVNNKYTDTSQYPFPGFRKLDENDTFTQDKAYSKKDNESYIISDLNLSVAANIVYGVYGKTIKEKGINSEEKEDYSEIIGTTTDENGTVILNDARAGKLPLGLFAENLGTISNITLDHHVVEGMEIVNGKVVYTCMVGGFVGNNIGKISKLAVLNTKSEGNSADNESRVIGRTDVGGILGRESFAVSESEKDVNLEGLLNYAEVIGMENIGGIAGRVWVNYPTNETPTNKYFCDGYDISNDNKSMSDKDIVRAESVVIEKCENRGHVFGLLNDKLLKDAVIDGKKTDTIKCSFIGGIVGSAMDGASVGDSIPEDYLVGSAEHIKITRCNSYISYDIDSDEVFGDLSDVTAHPSLTNDNYVGGLVGYGRLTVFENCNIKPEEEMMSENASKTFVFGNRFVGGLIGCAELCRFDKGQSEENEENSDYAVTNYNNVIGRLYVGGIAGANGIGNIDASDMNYREPSKNEASTASRINAENNSLLFYEALNKGTVLTLKSSRPFIARIMDEWKSENFDEISDIFSEEELTGISGGIVGLNCSAIKNCDNIQSEDTKKLSMKLVSGANTDFYNDEVSLNDIVETINSSPYGGNSVGGIAGACFEGGTINVPSSDDDYYQSKVDAFVFGQDYVGGSVGLTKTKDTEVCDGINKIVNGDANSVSSGLLVMGRDSVGGYIGRVGGRCYDYESTTMPYTVKGRYGVGGVFGVVSSKEDLAVTVDPIGTSNRIIVDGIAYVGGYIGVADSSNDIKLIGVNQKENDLDDVKVYGKYFAGGIAGCIAGTNKSLKYIAKTDFSLGRYVSVEADSFAGGIAGLYTISDESDDFCSVSGDYSTNSGKLHKLISQKLMESNAYVDYEKAFSNIANSDIDSGNVFGVSSDNCSISFKDYDDNTDSNTVKVSSKIFAGGLFGYVPEAVKLTVNGFVNNGNINVTKNISSSKVTESELSDVSYSFMGGVVGRVSSNMTLINCSNKKRGDDTSSSAFYISKASYIGGLTEVNAGVIRGTGEKDDKGNVVEDGYLVNSVNAEYSNVNYGAIAGINGTSKTKISVNDSGAVSDNSTGLIIYCKNAKKSGSDKDVVKGSKGDVAGIVAAVGGDSAIVDCVNEKQLQAVDNASGIVAQAINGKCIIDSCVNSATVSGTDNAAGILGLDKSSDDLTVKKCENTGAITSANGFAAGIVGKGISDNHTNSDLFVIDECINHGFVDAKECAAGIISDNKGSISINNSVNTGIITISGQHPKLDSTNGSDLKAAGIVCDTHQKGEISKCRNYGTGIYYGITKETAKSIHYSFDASYSDVHIGSVSDNETVNKNNNFYLGDEENIDRPKRFKSILSYPGSGEDEQNINPYVLGSSQEGEGQNGENPVHHDESGGSASIKKNNKTYNLQYTIQPVYNFVGLQATDIGMDAFSIVWDNFEKSTIDDYMAPTLNKDTTDYSVFTQKYKSKIENWINDPNNQIIIVDIINWIFGNNDPVGSVDLRKAMGLDSSTTGIGLLKRFRKNYPILEQTDPYNSDHTDGENYFSDYAYATYCYMIGNYEADDIDDDLYKQLLFGNAERFGKVAYDESKKTYNINYHINIYGNGEVKTLKPSGKNSFTTSITENDSFVRDTYILKDTANIPYYIKGVRQSQNIMTTGSVLIKEFDKIEVIIDSCTNNANTVGIRSFEWNESGKLSTAEPPQTEIMIAHDKETELSEDYYAGVSDISSFLDAVGDGNRPIFLSEISLYPEEDIKDGVTTHKLVSYGFETGIKSLDLKLALHTDEGKNTLINDFATYSVDSPSPRIRVYKEMDSKYMEFIESYIDGTLNVNTGTGSRKEYSEESQSDEDDSINDDSSESDDPSTDDKPSSTDDDSLEKNETKDDGTEKDNDEDSVEETATPGDAYFDF